MNAFIKTPEEAKEVKYPCKSMGQLQDLKLKEIDNARLTARQFDPDTDEEKFEY